MNLNQLITFISILYFNSFTIAQSDSTQWKLGISPEPYIGYLYQGEHALEFGLKIDYKNTAEVAREQYHKNLSLIIGPRFTWHNKVSYISPTIAIRYLKPIKGKYSFATSITYNYQKVRNINSQSISPEIGINHSSGITLSYGYNLFIDNKFNWVNPNKLSFKVMLN